MAQIARAPQRPDQAQKLIDLRTDSLLTLLLPRVAVVRQAGELARQPHLKTPAGRVQMSLPAVTRVTTPTATKIAESASLPPTTLPMAGVAAEAQVAPAVALAVLVAPVVPTVEVAAFPGKSTTSTGSF